MSKTIDEVMAALQSTVNRGEAAIAKLSRQIEEERAKISDANVTLRTLRAMGVTAERTDHSNQVAEMASPPTMTVPDMVLHVMKVAGKSSYEPAEVLDLIRQLLNVEPDPNNVRPTLWRMHKDGRLGKDDGGKYFLPSQEIESAGTPQPNGPALSIGRQPQAQGREAGPGGGT